MVMVMVCHAPHAFDWVLITTASVISNAKLQVFLPFPFESHRAYLA